MNKHARKDLTESTLIALAAILTQAGYRYSTGGVSITIPRKVAEDITALAYDLNNHNARKARLDQPQPGSSMADVLSRDCACDPSPQWQTGPVRVNGEVVA